MSVFWGLALRHPHGRPGLFRRAFFPLHPNRSCRPGPILSFSERLCFCLLHICVSVYGQTLKEQRYSPGNGLPHLVPLKCLQFFLLLDPVPRPPCFSEQSRNKGPTPRTGPRPVLSTSRTLGPAHSRGTAPSQDERNRGVPPTPPYGSWGSGDKPRLSPSS